MKQGSTPKGVSLFISSPGFYAENHFLSQNVLCRVFFTDDVF